ncbi:hypothetical protein QFZ94_007714 [Paraburkholderia sp. JPY465]
MAGYGAWFSLAPYPESSAQRMRHSPEGPRVGPELQQFEVFWVKDEDLAPLRGKNLIARLRVNPDQFPIP